MRVASTIMQEHTYSISGEEREWGVVGETLIPVINQMTGTWGMSRVIK